MARNVWKAPNARAHFVLQGYVWGRRVVPAVLKMSNASVENASARNVLLCMALASANVDRAAVRFSLCRNKQSPIHWRVACHAFTVVFLPKFLTIQVRMALPPSMVVIFRPPMPVSSLKGTTSKKGFREKPELRLALAVSLGPYFPWPFRCCSPEKKNKAWKLASLWAIGDDLIYFQFCWRSVRL